MSEIFILQNQDKLFLGRQNNWLDGRDLAALYKTAHKDEAINQMFEASSKDYKQRIKVLSCSPNERGLPLLNPDIMPEPLPKAGKDLFETLAQAAESPTAQSSPEQNDSNAVGTVDEPTPQGDQP